MATVLNPPVPYSGFFAAGPARAGTIVEFTGHVPTGSNGFTVNFRTQNNDIALHFNIRFGEGQIVLNSCNGGRWGKEQRVSADVFQHGAAFDLMFLVQHDQFGVSVNGSPYVEFNHRISKEEINRVEVDGDVVLSLAREACSLVPGAPAFNPPTPLKATISGGLAAGRQIVVIGTLTGNGFSVNCQVGQEHMHNVALHFNPRGNEGQIVMNHTADGNWGGEQRTHEFPFTVGQQFTIEIQAHSEHYTLLVNGSEVAQFNHRDLGRHPLEAIDTLFIDGELELHQVMVQ